VVECCAWINLMVLCGVVVIFYDFVDGGCPFFMISLTVVVHEMFF